MADLTVSRLPGGDQPVRWSLGDWMGTVARRIVAAPAVLVAVLAWCLYLPSAASVVQLSPDMVEFVDVARRVADGEGYLLGIKAYHLGGLEVMQDGLIHRPPLFTLVMAGLLRLGVGLPAVQVVNAALGAVSAAMVCSLGTRLFGRAVGSAAGVLAALSPIGLEQQVPILSDALATALTLVALRLMLRAVDRSSWLSAALSGGVFGLGYLTRPPVLVILIALVVVWPLILPRGQRCWRLLASVLVGAALICVPVTLFSLIVHGRLSYSGKGYLYGVVSDADVMENGFASMPLTPVEFVTQHPAFVLSAIANVSALYLRSLFTEREWLAPLAIGWPAVLLGFIRGRLSWPARVVLVAAATNFLFYGLTWSSWQDRFMLTTLFLLLPFAVDGIWRTLHWLAGWLATRHDGCAVARRLPGPALVVVVIVVAALWLPRFVDQYQGRFRYGERPVGARLTDGLRWSGPPRWVNDGSLDEAISWIRTHTDDTDVLAHGQPWPYTFFTGRPSVLLPYRLSDERLRSLIVEYRVSYVLYDPRDPQRRDYLDQLRALADDGVRSTRVESLIVFDTRALWQSP